MLRHALREDVPPNAVPGAPPPQLLAGEATSRAAMQRVHAAIAKAKAMPRGWRANSVRALDLLVTTSPADAARLGKAGQDRYFAAALDWIAQHFGGRQNILTATVHRDETTPHMQVLLMPLTEDGRFLSSRFVGGRQHLSDLQDSFWEACGRPAKLLRGVKRSPAKHLPQRAMYGAMEAGEDPPRWVEVPAPPEAPGLLASAAKKREYEAQLQARQRALDHNQAERERLERQAAAGRRMHPTAVARQAERYRQAQLAEQHAKKTLAEAQEARQAAEKAQHKAQVQLAESRLQAKAASGLWEKAGAQMLDRWSVTMHPAMVARLAAALGIDLVAGRPLLDQVRRAGKATTMLEAAELLDRVLDGELRRHVDSGAAQRDLDRRRGGS